MQMSAVTDNFLKFNDFVTDYTNGKVCLKQTGETFGPA